MEAVGTCTESHARRRYSYDAMFARASSSCALVPRWFSIQFPCFSVCLPSDFLPSSCLSKFSTLFSFFPTCVCVCLFQTWSRQPALWSHCNHVHCRLCLCADAGLVGIKCAKQRHTLCVVSIVTVIKFQKNCRETVWFLKEDCCVEFSAWNWEIVTYLLMKISVPRTLAQDYVCHMLTAKLVKWWAMWRALAVRFPKGAGIFLTFVWNVEGFEPSEYCKFCIHG